MKNIKVAFINTKLNACKYKSMAERINPVRSEGYPEIESLQSTVAVLPLVRQIPRYLCVHRACNIVGYDCRQSYQSAQVQRQKHEAMTSTHSTRILAGDIGGTKTRLAIIDVAGHSLQTRAESTYPSQEHASLRAIVQAFLKAHDEPVAAACFGVAGPVRHQMADVTNLPWHINAGELEQRFSIGDVSLLNDLEANAWGIEALGPDDIFELHAGDPDAAGNAAIIAAGTGLGEAGMFFDGKRHRPFATEGGHTDFSPCCRLETELQQFLAERYSHVSWERVLAGPGLVNIHSFLRHQRSVETPGWLAEKMHNGDPAAAISDAAQSGQDDICEEALEMFIRLYGAEAGNLALKHMASGGIYIGGGIAPKILDWLKKEDFMRAFLAKGRMRSLLERIPVRVILNDRTALYGPAVYAALSLETRN